MGARRLKLLGWLAAAALAAGTARAADGGFYHLVGTVGLPGKAPEWDYLTIDPAHNHLFIGRREAGIAVIDLGSRTLIRTLDRSNAGNAVALVPQFDRGYTTNEDGTTTVFEPSTLRTLDRIKLGDDADAGFFEPVSRQMVFTQGDSHRLAFLDARTARVLGTLPMDSGKLDGAVPDGKGHLLVAERDRDAIAVVDVARRHVDGVWPTIGCHEPTGVAYDDTHRRLLVGCRGQAPVLAVLDGDTGKVVATVPIGRGVDGVIYDAADRQVLTSNGVDANLVVYDQVDADHYTLQQATTTRPYARTMARDPATGRIYTVTAEGTADPARKINTAVAPFYPNRFFDDTFTLLIYDR